MTETKDVTVIENVAEVPVSTTGTGNMFFDVAKFEFAQRVAAVFSKSTMVPDHFKANIGNCLIAMNYAERTGTDPFMCMQKMYIIHGKPAVETQFAIAMLNSSGKFTPIEYDMDDKKTRCIAHAVNLATGSKCEGPEVSLKMASDEGWTSKKGSKWKTMPEIMLRYRAAIFFIRLYAPEVMMGMPSKEEVTDAQPMPAQEHKKKVLKAQEDKKASVQASIDKQTEEAGMPPEEKPAKKKRVKKTAKPEDEQITTAAYKQFYDKIRSFTSVSLVNGWWEENKDAIMDALSTEEYKKLLAFKDEHIKFIKDAIKKDMGDD